VKGPDTWSQNSVLGLKIS